MGTPIIALHGVTGLPLQDLSSMAGRQTPMIALLVPLLLVFIVDGRRDCAKPGLSPSSPDSSSAPLNSLHPTSSPWN